MKFETFDKTGTTLGTPKVQTHDEHHDEEVILPPGVLPRQYADEPDTQPDNTPGVLNPKYERNIAPDPTTGEDIIIPPRLPEPGNSPTKPRSATGAEKEIQKEIKEAEQEEIESIKRQTTQWD